MMKNGRKPIQPGAVEDACPRCGEREADDLVWIDDEIVQCKQCGTAFRPEDQREVPGNATR